MHFVIYSPPLFECARLLYSHFKKWLELHFILLFLLDYIRDVNG